MTDVELIKSKIDIVEFINERVPLKKAGRNFKALCPFHNEKTPSFYVSPERQVWHCFGCHIGGDVISFFQKWENLEFLEALKILAQKTDVKLSGYFSDEKTKLKEKLLEINHLSSEFFHYLLTSHKIGERARVYLEKRGIRKETIKTFSLGYAPESWDSLMRFLTKKGYKVNDLLTAGLLVQGEKGRYYDRFRGRLIFSLKDHRGNIIGFSGRKLEEKTKEAKYINTPETPLYIKGNTLYGLEVTREAIKKEGKAIVVEGEFDMLSSFQAGIPNVVAIKGSALTEGQVLLLKRFTSNLVFSLDSDFAGNEAAKRGIEIAENAGMIVTVVSLPVGKDPAECIEKSPFLWKKAVKEAVPIYDFIISSAVKKYQEEGVIGKRKISDEVLPFLAKIQNPILASHYIKELAKKLEVGEEAIALAIRRLQKKEKLEMPVIGQERNMPSREVILEEYFLALIIQSPKIEEVLQEVAKILSSEDLSIPSVKKIFELLLAFVGTNKKFEAKKFSEILPPELIPLFNKAYLFDLEKLLSEEKKFFRELYLVAWEIKKLSLRRKIASLSTKIKQSEEKEKEVKKWQDELKSLLSQLREIEKQVSRKIK